MKKYLTLVLALIMVMSLSVTAFAEGEQSGTTTLTANIPNAAEPSYTIHIPADMTLEYGNTGKQLIGNVYVTDVANCDQVCAYAPYTDLVNTSDSTDIIPLTLYSQSAYFDYFDEIKPSDGFSVEYGVTPVCAYDRYFAGLYGYDANGYCTTPFYVEVSDWSGATPGATYKAVITFEFYTYSSI